MRSGIAFAAMLAVASCAAPTAPTAPTAQVPRCEARVIVGLARPATPRPADAWVADVARTARVRLTWLRSVSSELHVFALSADGDDASCSRAIARLRADRRIRSVDPDSRREAHPSGSAPGQQE